MQGRLNGSTTRTRSPTTPKGNPPGHVNASVILGIDPSLRGTGYGVIQTHPNHPLCLAHGTIKCPSTWVRSRCFLKIAHEISTVLKEHHPDVCVIEGLFFAQNLQTALIMGEARGVSMVTVAQAGLDIYEISPRKVKLAIVGYGAAQKDRVARMVQRLLNLDEPPAPDAADALALALAHAQDQRRTSIKPLRKL